MTDIPDATDLLTTARDVFIRDVLPALPKDMRYTGLMAANAIAIALREQATGTVAKFDEAGQLCGLLAAADVLPRRTMDTGSDLDLPPLRRALAAAIREGRFDDDTRASALHAHLMRTATAWVAISNPKALRQTVTLDDA